MAALASCEPPHIAPQANHSLLTARRGNKRPATITLQSCIDCLRNPACQQLVIERRRGRRHSETLPIAGNW